jgi:hypothetical protein
LLFIASERVQSTGGRLPEKGNVAKPYAGLTPESLTGLLAVATGRDSTWTRLAPGSVLKHAGDMLFRAII